MSVKETAACDPLTSVTTISFQLPSFWPSDPKIWFAQVEARFTTRDISAQKTKYNYIVASLSPEFPAEVRDLILKVLETDPYIKVKEQFIKQIAVSEQRRLQQLFNAKELGDRKPTQLLQRMQQLPREKANTTDGSFLCHCFSNGCHPMFIWS